MIKREIQKIDAAGKTPGRLATKIASFLIGKGKAGFTPNIDSGDSVEVVNASKMAFTGKKLDQRVYYGHTAHPGGFKAEPMKIVMRDHPQDVLRRAVSRMIPKNKMRDGRMKRLTILK